MDATKIFWLKVIKKKRLKIFGKKKKKTLNVWQRVIDNDAATQVQGPGIGPE